MNASTDNILYKSQTSGKRACVLTILTALCSFCGWIAETILFYVWRSEFVDRGLLTLPLCPLYGLSMLAAYGIMRTPQSGFWKKLYSKPKTKGGKVAAVILSVILYAVLAALLATLAELITGIFYYKKFGVRLWSYHSYDNSLGGYVCLQYSLMWGVLAVVFMGLVWHPLMQLLSRVDIAVLLPIAFVVIALMAGDFTFNMFYLYIKGRRFTPF